MPRYYPNTRFSDCWSSVGDITFYHRNGICYFRSKAHGEFPGTGEQLVNLDLHRRAIAAWRSLDHNTQAVWGSLAESVEAHRPPFNDGNHISGYNLFVSAYHGHAQLGNEHTPEPRKYENFPFVNCEFASAEIVDGNHLSIKLRVKLDGNADPTRYRVAVRIQLTRPGAGRQPGYLRSFIASGNCDSNDGLVEIFVPNYRDVWSLDLDEYQVHMRYFLIDSKNGYRCNFKKKSFVMKLK